MKLVSEPAGLQNGTHHGSAAELLFAWLSDCASVKLRCGFVAVQEIVHLNGVETAPCVAVYYAELPDYAGVEAEYKYVQHDVLVVYWTEHFALRTVGSLVE